MTLASETRPLASASLQSVSLELCAACDAYHADPKNLAHWDRLRPLRRRLAQVVLEMPATAKQSPDALGLTGVVEKLMQSGVMDQSITADDQDFLSSLKPRAWNHLLAAMLVAPAWDWRAAPMLDDVPNWMWGIYTRYLFHFPQSFTELGQAEKYADHHLRRLTELERWVTINRGSSLVRGALDTYLAHANCIPLYFSTSSLKKHYELRARILAVACGTPKQHDLPPFSREGRRLRIGFVKLHWGPQTETYSTMPTFEKIDRERFEVCLYALHETGSDVEAYLRSNVAEFHTLPGTVESRLQTLIGANLDVLVFATNVTAVTNDILLLALHRIAPLQVMHHPSCATTGLPEMDLYVSGELTESDASPAQFTERLALLPGPSHAFNYEVDRQDPGQVPTRADLGLADDAVLFVSAANYYKIIPEMMHLWARLLKRVPGSKLLVHPFNPNWSSDYPIQRFCAEFDRVLDQHGVSHDAILISTAKYPSRSDVKELLRLGHVYLDTFPFSGVNSLIDPLECAVPCLVWEGETFRARMASAVMKQLEIPELIVHSEEEYLALAERLATDHAFRDGLKTKIAAAMERTPLFMDTLAASDSFGALMEAAFDELVNVGRDAFRANRTPILASAPEREGTLAEANSNLEIGLAGTAWDQVRPLLGRYPQDAAVRRAAGRALTGIGRADRAAQYLLESVQHCDGDVAHWLDLAQALLQAGNLKNALETVQIILQLDAKNVEAILVLGEIAERTGQLDQIAEAVAVAEQAAPSDFRVITLASKVAQAVNPPSL